LTAPISATDFLPPAIGQIVTTPTAAGLQVRVAVNDNSGTVQRVVLLYAPVGAAQWSRAELAYNPATGYASGRTRPLAGPVDYFIQATDPSGNVAVALDDGNPFRIVVNVKAPLEAPTVTGTRGADGWYISPPAVTWSVAANGSPIVSTAGCATTVFTTETPGTTLTCTASNAVSTSSRAVTIKLDQTAPTQVVLTVAAGTLAASGWYTSTVLVHTSGTETVSNPLICTPDQRITDTPGVVVTGACTNDAGLTTSATPLSIKVDQTPPTITFGSFVNGATYTTGSVPAAACTVADATSGPVSPSCLATLQGYSTALGSHTLRAQAADHAGNRSTARLTYRVVP
jgi:hypothetical protein